MSKAMGWHQLLDHLQDAALLFGADGAVIRWNDAAVGLLGLAAKAEGGDSEPTGIELFDQIDRQPQRGGRHLQRFLHTGDHQLKQVEQQRHPQHLAR